MSDTGTRLPLAEAEILAGEIVSLLAPYCERLEIVGSIRRRKADIGDVEILAIPRFQEWASATLFGDPERVNTLDCFCRGLLTGFVFNPRGRGAFGERYKQLEYKGFAMDLFSCLPPAQWGVLQVIRTGPADFSHRLVKDRRYGGMLPPWAVVREGAIWHRDGALQETPTEADVFRMLGVEFVPPEARI
jgi:DNA polymerase/3'-5' exonuclease PolX